MPSSVLIQRGDVIELARNRRLTRGENYRERAAQLRGMAETETIDRVRDDLLRLADQYEGIAAQLT